MQAQHRHGVHQAWLLLQTCLVLVLLVPLLLEPRSLACMLLLLLLHRAVRVMHRCCITNHDLKLLACVLKRQRLLLLWLLWLRNLPMLRLLGRRSILLLQARLFCDRARLQAAHHLKHLAAAKPFRPPLVPESRHSQQHGPRALLLLQAYCPLQALQQHKGQVCASS
jgi:hypothetical protein